MFRVILPDVLLGHLHGGPKSQVQEGQEIRLKTQLVFQILNGKSIGLERHRPCSGVRLVVRLRVIGEQGSLRLRVYAWAMANIHPLLNQLLIDQALRRLLPRSEAEIRFLAVLERHQTDSQLNFAASDDVGSNRYRNAVDQ